jgi:hypothetical protein
MCVYHVKYLEYPTEYLELFLPLIIKWLTQKLWNIDFCFEQGPGKTKKGKVHAGRSALADINPNIIHVKYAAPAQKKSSSMKAKFPKGLRRGMSRSLDSCEASINQVNFEPLKRDQGSLENLTHGVLHKTELPVINTVTEGIISLHCHS